MYITLDLAKRHLNLESGYTSDDALLLVYIEAAEKAVEVHTNTSLDELAEAYGGVLPAPLIQAMLLQIGNFYQNREIIGNKTDTVPFAYQYLINLYRNFD